MPVAPAPPRQRSARRTRSRPAGEPRRRARPLSKGPAGPPPPAEPPPPARPASSSARAGAGRRVRGCRDTAAARAGECGVAGSAAAPALAWAGGQPRGAESAAFLSPGRPFPPFPPKGDESVCCAYPSPAPFPLPLPQPLFPAATSFRGCCEDRRYLLSPRVHRPSPLLHSLSSRSPGCAKALPACGRACGQERPEPTGVEFLGWNGSLSRLKLGPKPAEKAKPPWVSAAGGGMTSQPLSWLPQASRCGPAGAHFASARGRGRRGAAPTKACVVECSKTSLMERLLCSKE